MDRLTLIKHGDVLIKDGWYKKARDEYSSLCFGCSNIGRCVNRCGFYKAHKRLAEYEDTGFEPEEIKKLWQDYKDGEYEYCGEYGTDDCQFQYRLEKIEQDRDYWKREALKWASKLGENKL